MDFRFNGNEKNLRAKISQFVDEGVIEKFIEELEKYSFIEGEGEYIETSYDLPELSEGLGFLTLSKKYNISLKMTTIAILLALLGATTFGISDKFLEWAGSDLKKMQGIYKLDDNDADKCILIEMLRSKPRIADESILPPTNQECINNHLLCKYRSNDKCTIQKDEVAGILLKLYENNVLRKEGPHYKYNF
ncbi:MAG: hypothetical protein FWE28_05310 [Oscillospiraceae bacterium]|nr:hypothetical protein [Oscillospiraceae bacterium]